MGRKSQEKCRQNSWDEKALMKSIKIVINEAKAKIMKSSSGTFFIKKGTEIFDPSMKKWINSKDFVHSTDWDGITFNNKKEAEKILGTIK